MHEFATRPEQTVHLVVVVIERHWFGCAEWSPCPVCLALPLRNRNWDQGQIWPQLDFTAMTYRADGEISETGNYSPQELEDFKP